MENKKRTISIMGIFLLVLTLVGGTLAYWTWTTNTAEQTNVVFTITSDFSCAADGGGDITSDDVSLAPTTCTDTSRAIKRKVTVTPTINRNDLTISMDLWLDVKSLGSGLSASDNFKYVLTTSDSSCEEGTIIVEGNFKGLGENSKVNLLSGKRYTKTSIVPEEYYLYIWLDKNETNSNTMNQPFNLSLNGICTDNIFFVVPEGATYIDVSGEFEDGVWCSDVSGEGTIYNAGDVVYTEPSTCDEYSYDNYVYTYNSAVVDSGIPSVDNMINGWGVIFNGSTKNPGEILTSINGRDVVGLVGTFMNASIDTAPVIPSTIKYMDNAFFDSTVAGTIQIDTNPLSYGGAFYNNNTGNSIMLTGSSMMLEELAATRDTGNAEYVDNWSANFVVPEGAVYYVRSFEDNRPLGSAYCYDLSSYTKKYVAGDLVLEKPTSCDTYVDNNYTYVYNESYLGGGEVDFSLIGWHVTSPTINNGVAGEIKTSINGKFVKSLSSTFMDNSSLVTAPKIPSSIISMYQTFKGCTNLTGTIQIDGVPSYGLAFDGTIKPITLIGENSIYLEKVAATSSNGNVIVGN